MPHPQKTVLVDILYPLPENYRLCGTCEAFISQIQSIHHPSNNFFEDYPIDYQKELLNFSDLILELAALFPQNVRLLLWDPRTPQGLGKSIRYHIHHYPAFIVNQHFVLLTPNKEEVKQAILKALDNPVETRNAKYGSVFLMIWKSTRTWTKILINKLKGLMRALADMLYGATIYEIVRDLEKERGNLERLFVLLVFGDLLGIPIIPPYYTLRLIPFIIPQVHGFKRSVLRERDFTDLCDQEIT